MTGERVMFYVQHLWGVGHVYRATRIANALAAAGMDVHLVWGGTRLPGFDFSSVTLHELTPVRTSDASFSQLLHADGSVFEEAEKDARRRHLLDIFTTLEPNVLITEAFPFGRRQMRFELVPLLEAARSSKWCRLVVASIRDIMQENRKPARVEESNAFVEQFFDLVLVHGDPALIPIEATLQGVESFREKIRYTGLVGPDIITPEKSEATETDVLVSVGGGAFGRKLLEVSLQTAAKREQAHNTWLVTTGTEMAEPDFQAIVGDAPANTKVVRHLPNLVQYMAKARVSVSHAGYNTVADVLTAGCASVLYPYTGGRETEQLRRAEMMHEKGVSQMIAPGELGADALHLAIEAAGSKKPEHHGLNINGAANSAGLLIDTLNS